MCGLQACNFILGFLKMYNPDPDLNLSHIY